MKKLLFVGLLFFIATSFVLSQNLISSVDEKYENGNIKEISYHKKRLKKIELVEKETYYENGQIRSEENYKDGAEHGKWANYHENGQKDWEKNYKDGKKNGKYIEYFENGQKKREGNFKNGKQGGRWIRYYENGQIEIKANLIDGKLNGKWTIYKEDGSIDKIEVLKSGELVENICGQQTFDVFCGGNCSSNTAEFADAYCEIAGYGGAESYTELNSGRFGPAVYYNNSETGLPDECSDIVYTDDTYGTNDECTCVDDLVCYSGNISTMSGSISKIVVLKE